MRKICSIIMAMSMVLVNVQSDITAAELTATDATERESMDTGSSGERKLGQTKPKWEMRK